MKGVATAGSPAEQLREARRMRLRVQGSRVGFLGLLVLLLYAASLMAGDTFYGPSEVIRVIAGETVPGASFAVGELRLPRASLGLLSGLAFGVAGVTFQTLLRNQLASPDIIGISSGASVAGVIGIVMFGASQVAVSGAALAAAITTAMVIYLLSYRNGFAGTRLILIGIGVSSMLGSVVAYVLSQAAAWDLQTATRWLTGSLNGATWEQVAPVALVCLLVLPLMVANSHSFGALRFGDDTATGLGVRVRLARVVAIVGAVSLVAVATAACGPVAFVAFMSGPIAARVVGPAASLLVPASLVGAGLMLLSDLVGQNAFGTRYPVGIITGALGAPFLIYLLIRSNRQRRA